ncbi:hypothetical protein B296_00027695 [Ensete ventricosum]|uniref:Uncharacterized protein n=1 Tax=Ensete ventricosum TaxID=4639 RepID=A0A426ZRV6_ENSVE|nr:hypothetical protein B296_00027695 [Ensete ventricosum]
MSCAQSVKKEVNLFLIGLTLTYHSPYVVVVLANLSFSLSPSLFPASLETLLKPTLLNCLKLPPHWHHRRLPRRRQDLKDPRRLHSPLQATAPTPSSKAIGSSFSSALARFLTNAVEASSASTIAATLFQCSRWNTSHFFNLSLPRSDPWPQVLPQLAFQARSDCCVTVPPLFSASSLATSPFAKKQLPHLATFLWTLLSNSFNNITQHL